MDGRGSRTRPVSRAPWLRVLAELPRSRSERRPRCPVSNPWRASRAAPHPLVSARCGCCARSTALLCVLNMPACPTRPFASS